MNPHHEILKQVRDDSALLKELKSRLRETRARRAVALVRGVAAGVSKNQLRLATGLSAGAFYKELAIGDASEPRSQVSSEIDF